MTFRPNEAAIDEIVASCNGDVHGVLGSDGGAGGSPDQSCAPGSHWDGDQNGGHCVPDGENTCATGHASRYRSIDREGNSRRRVIATAGER